MISDRVLAAMRARLAAALAPPQGRYRPLRVERAAAGWLDDRRAARLSAMPDVFAVRDDGVSFVAGTRRRSGPHPARSSASRARSLPMAC